VLWYKQAYDEKDQTIAELRQLIAGLLERRIRQLEEEVAATEKNSGNSSKPAPRATSSAAEGATTPVEKTKPRSTTGTPQACPGNRISITVNDYELLSCWTGQQAMASGGHVSRVVRRFQVALWSSSTLLRPIASTGVVQCC